MMASILGQHQQLLGSTYVDQVFAALEEATCNPDTRTPVTWYHQMHGDIAVGAINSTDPLILKTFGRPYIPIVINNAVADDADWEWYSLPVDLSHLFNLKISVSRN